MNEYFYELPKELIAQKPAEPRDEARLFVYDIATDSIYFDIFKNCAHYIPKESVLVLNTTKVVPARVFMKKETGGRVEVLFLVNEYKGSGSIRGIADRKLTIGQNIFFENGDGFLIEAQENQFFILKPLFPETEIVERLERFGVTPIPPYIEHHNMDEDALRVRYQSVFAKIPSSIAAPTASLHFTDAVFSALKEKIVETATITLHVGMGTFARVTDDQKQKGELHKEWYSIPDTTIEAVKGKRVIPVGTTAMRALESYAKTGEKSGDTNLFIKKPFHFKIASGLITNFHVPESSLMFLVDAFLADKNAKRSILDLYAIAVRERFRFYSFGDAMLIL